MIDSIAVLDDGRMLASDDAADLMAWTPARPDDTRTLIETDAAAPGSSITGIDADDAGERALLSMATYEGNALVDLGTGDVARTFPAGEPGPNSGTTFTGAMSRDGSLVASFDVAGRGYVFDSGSGDLVGRLTGGHIALVNGLAFGAGGVVLSAGLDGLVRTWDGDASATEGTGPNGLCDTFAPRIDEDSWSLALGDEPFASPCPEGSAGEAPPAADLDVETADLPGPSGPEGPAPILEEGFDDDTTPLGLGRTTVGDGTLDRRIADGSYEMEVAGQGPTFQTWTMAGVGPGRTSYAVSVRILAGDGLGPCGLTVAGTDSQLTVVVDPTNGSGLLTWFAGVRVSAPGPFGPRSPAPPPSHWSCAGTASRCSSTATGCSRTATTGSAWRATSGSPPSARTPARSTTCSSPQADAAGRTGH